MWVYNIGSSSFTDIIPGRATTVLENVFPQEATKISEPRFFGREEFTSSEEPPYEPETNIPEISTPEAIPPEQTLPETILPHLELEPEIQDQSQLTYNHQPPQGNHPHQDYPLPRGPRPLDPQVVVLEEQDEDLNVRGKMLPVYIAKNTAKCSTHYPTNFCLLTSI